jgi:hypothetical protein
VVSIMAVLVWQAAAVGRNAERLEQVATETHDSLCALKNDIERRRSAGLKFVKENPDGIPGISRAQLDQSLSSQKSTLDALGVLDCQ